MLHLAGPGQVYGDLGSNGKNNSLVHGIVPLFGFSLRVARFFRAHHHVCINYTRKRGKCQIFFCEKIAKNVKTGAILANFSFFVKFFAGKSRKVSNSREKLPKMVESDFNLEKCVFFVNVSPFVGQDRQILPCLRSGDLKLQSLGHAGDRGGQAPALR